MREYVWWHAVYKMNCQPFRNRFSRYIEISTWTREYVDIRTRFAADREYVGDVVCSFNVKVLEAYLLLKFDVASSRTFPKNCVTATVKENDDSKAFRLKSNNSVINHRKNTLQSFAERLTTVHITAENKNHLLPITYYHLLLNWHTANTSRKYTSNRMLNTDIDCKR